MRRGGLLSLAFLNAAQWFGDQFVKSAAQGFHQHRLPQGFGLDRLVRPAIRIATGAAGLPQHCTFHGLRKASLTRLADAGCTAHEIAAISGHRTLAEVERYTRKADQQRLARSAMERVGNTSVKPEADQVSNALNPLAKITG
jgi:integrase